MPDGIGATEFGGRFAAGGGAMNLFSKTLACSGLLAARQQAVVPDLPLAWNPRDDKSTLRAVDTFLSHVAAHVFPVANSVFDLDTSIEYLTHIPLMGQGFNYWYEVSYDEMFPGLHRLLCTFLTLETNLEMDPEAAYAAYIALRDEGIDEMVPLFKVYGWLEACISGERPFLTTCYQKAQSIGRALLISCVICQTTRGSSCWTLATTKKKTCSWRWNWIG